jgi:hypothetical protein
LLKRILSNSILKGIALNANIFLVIINISNYNAVQKCREILNYTTKGSIVLKINTLT